MRLLARTAWGYTKSIVWSRARTELPLRPLATTRKSDSSSKAGYQLERLPCLLLAQRAWNSFRCSMQSPVDIHLLVEGSVDAAIARTLIRVCGASPGMERITRGKSTLVGVL